MHVLLFQFYRFPNPDYDNIAAGLRRRGHIVWQGNCNQHGDLEWCDGERVIARQLGPAPMPKRLLRIPILGQVLERARFLGFMLRVRHFFRQARPDVIHLFPGACHGLWLLPLFMPRHMYFVFDIRQINLTGHSGLVGRLGDWQVVTARKIVARLFYHHSCFNHACAARKILGEQWARWATVVPVGLSPRFLTVERADRSARDTDSPVRFIYLGALTQFRELDVLFAAIKRASASTRNFRVRFVGPDKAQGFYHDLVDELNLDDVVSLEPVLPYERIPELLACQDVGLAYTPDRPTWHLQPTIKVLEYRAVGLPILSSDVASHREIVSQEVNGLLVPNCVESLAEAMLRFINDRDFLDVCQLAAAGMRCALTIDEVATMYERDVYDRLVEGQFSTSRSTPQGSLEYASKSSKGSSSRP